MQKIADMKSEKCAEVVCFWLCDENAAYANLSCQNCGQVIGWQDGRHRMKLRSWLKENAEN